MKKKLKGLVLTSSGVESKQPLTVFGDMLRLEFLTMGESPLAMAFLHSISNNENSQQRKNPTSHDGIYGELTHGLQLTKPTKKNTPGYGLVTFSSRNTKPRLE